MVLLNGWLLIIFDIMGVATLCVVRMMMSDIDYRHSEKQQRINSATIIKGCVRKVNDFVRMINSLSNALQKSLAIDRRRGVGFNGFPRQ